MIAREAVGRVVQVLEALGVQYVLVGSLSSNHWGVVRSTVDADFRASVPDI